MDPNDSTLEQPVEETKTYDDGVVDTVTVVSVCGILFAAYQIWFVNPKSKDIFTSLRVDIPLPTQFVLWLGHNGGLCFIFLGVGLVLVELVRRKRSRRLAISIMVVALVSGPIAHECIALPIYKIQDQLRKK